MASDIGFWLLNIKKKYFLKNLWCLYALFLWKTLVEEVLKFFRQL